MNQRRNSFEKIHTSQSSLTVNHPTQLILIILKFHVKFCNTLAENSTGQFKTEVQLTRFNNVHIICLKQFHKKTCYDNYTKIYTGLTKNSRYYLLLITRLRFKEILHYFV